VSVDIDLTYLPLKPRAEALKEVHESLHALKGDIERRVSGSRVQTQHYRGSIVKLTVSTGDAVVSIEPNLVLRGSVYPPENRDLCPPAQEHFGVFVEAQTLSIADLYGGKLCATLDRQHPRDLFDVMLMLRDTGITPEIRRAFVVYLAGHDRPMSELLAPRLKDISQLYLNHFLGMTRGEVSLDDLVGIQSTLARTLVAALTDEEKQFLISIKRGQPEWHRIGIDHIAQLPSIQWKLINIRKMNPLKHRAALDRLARVLEI
jgi:predicted nucleotidyltransferase component of viral defense system